MKTWLTSIFCCTRAVLFPGSKIIISSGTKGQSREVIEKIDDLRKEYPNLAREISDLKSSANDAKVEFHNGSWIKTVASNDGARSKRANVLVIDEFRMVDLDIINKVLRKFLTAPRSPKYLEKPEYAHLQERNMEMFLSSCWYSHHWSYNRFIAYFKSMMKGSKYFVCGLPYQIAIKEGLLMKDQVLDEMSEEDFDEISWSMEMGCLWFGESEKAYFKFEDLDKNRRLSTPVYPRETYDLMKDVNFKYPDKKGDEVRLISCDIAGMAGKANDASVYSIFRLIPNGTYYERQLVYMESVSGGNTVTQATRIRQLFNDFQCNYIVLDTQGMGLGVYDNLILPMYDRERSVEYEPFSCINSEDMANRCTYQNAPKLIYSIKANAQLNSEIATGFRDVLRRGKLKLMINENDGREHLKKIKGFDRLTEETKAQLVAPYLQTSALINEMINLEAEFNDNGLVKLKEPSSKRKDRWSSVSYGNYVAGILEKKLHKDNEILDDSVDWILY